MKTYRPAGEGRATPPTGNPTSQGINGTDIDVDQAEAIEFPFACLGDTLQEMGIAISATERVPSALAACCLLGILSASIGSGLQVRSGPNRRTRGNLYILGSAESGSGKSETFRHAARPLQEFEAARLKEWRDSERPALLAEKDILESEVAKFKKMAASSRKEGAGSPTRDELRDELTIAKTALAKVEAELNAPVLSVDDVTTERLAALLSQNAEQLASLSADAVAVVTNLLGRYSKVNRTDEGVYLKAFSGDRCRVDRQSGEPVLLESPCLSALWLTQPDKLEAMLAEPSLCDGGLMPRMLACHTRCEPRPIIETAPCMPSGVREDYAALIAALLKTFRLTDEPFIIEPNPEALKSLNEHHNQIVARRRGDLQDVTIFAARWTEQVWRIAVCLHAAEHGIHAGSKQLSIETAQRAIEVGNWFSARQLEILAAGREKAKRKKRDAVLKLLMESPKGITARDIQRARVVVDAKSCSTLVAEMEADGHLSGVDHKPDGGGHVTRLYKRPAQ